jgi:pyridoxamine 5'-phosphate oxidase-like protein
MASWSDFAAAAPALAERVQERFDAHKHKTMATLRKDGSPRISGTECQFNDGELWIGSMWKAVKALDLQRDGRYALHSATFDPDDDWGGEAKIAGTAHEIVDEDEVKARNGEAGANGPSHAFRLDVTEVSTVGLDATKKLLVIEVWTAERGLRTIQRD